MISVQEVRNRCLALTKKLNEGINDCFVPEDLESLEKGLDVILQDFQKKLKSEKDRVYAEKKKINKEYTEASEGKTVRIKINAIKEMKQFTGTFHCYEVETFLGKKYGKALLRYSMFADFNKKLVAFYKEQGKSSLIENIPSLPSAKSKLFGAHDLDFIRDRKASLQTYLDIVSKLPEVWKCEAFRKLLEVGA
mmetsp:Transcript_11150/g.17828  ORF Transcript_11150/g.17828 Transcript_11150/m.17828 type:complete len:193 (-) Transcript_11150:332-910(-)